MDSRADGGPLGATSSAPAVDVDQAPWVRGAGLVASSLRPIRRVFGRGQADRPPAEPTWPKPSSPDDRVAPIVTTADLSEPCPFCADSRERGAWFCRRCRRPLDPRATAATSAVILTPAAPPSPVTLRPVPTSTPIAAILGTTQASPAGAERLREPRPVFARPPVVQRTLVAPTAISTAMDPTTRTAPSDSLAAPATTSAANASGPATNGAAPDRKHVAPRRVAVGPGRPHGTGRTGRVEAGSTTGGRGIATESNAIDLRAAVGGRVDLNRASAEQLSALRGIGPVTAKRIIAARADRAFETVDGLLDRKIVRRSVIDRLRDHVTV